MTRLAPSTLDALKDQNLLGTGSEIGRGGIELRPNINTLTMVRANTFLGINPSAEFNRPQTIEVTAETLTTETLKEYTPSDFIGIGDAIGNGGRILETTPTLLFQVTRNKMLTVNPKATFNTAPLPTNVRPSTISVGARFSSVVPVRPSYMDETSKTIPLPLSTEDQKKRIKASKGLIKFPTLETTLEISKRVVPASEGTTQIQVSQEQLDIINAIDMTRLKPTRTGGAYTNKELMAWIKSLGIKLPGGKGGTNKPTLVYYIKEHIGKIAPEKLLEE